MGYILFQLFYCLAPWRDSSSLRILEVLSQQYPALSRLPLKKVRKYTVKHGQVQWGLHGIRCGRRPCANLLLNNPLLYPHAYAHKFSPLADTAVGTGLSTVLLAHPADAGWGRHLLQMWSQEMETPDIPGVSVLLFPSIKGR